MVALSNINLGKPAALVVESDPALRRLTSAILRQNGYRVYESAMGVDSWQLEESDSSLDVLVVGMNLSGGRSGLRVAKQVWDENPAVKIIVTGASSPTEDEMRIVREAGITFLSLPYSFGRLSRAAAVHSSRAA